MAIIDRRGVIVDATDTITAGDPNPGLAIKTPCRVATTGNITLSGLQTIDGVTVVDGDRVLVWQQTDARNNGIYAASSGIWQRTLDADSNDQWVDGLVVWVNEGATYRRSVFVCESGNPVTLGTSDIVFDVVQTPQVSLTFVIDGGGAPIVPGIAGDLHIPFSSTVLYWSLLADAAGSITVDVWKTPIGSFPPTIANSMTGTGTPAIVAAVDAQSSDLTGWSTVQINTNDVLRFSVLANDTIRRVTVSLVASRL